MGTTKALQPQTSIKPVPHVPAPCLELLTEPLSCAGVSSRTCVEKPSPGQFPLWSLVERQLTIPHWLYLINVNLTKSQQCINTSSHSLSTHLTDIQAVLHMWLLCLVVL